MKLVSFELHGVERVGIAKEGYIILLRAEDMNSFLSYSEEERERIVLLSKETVSFSDAKILAPVPHPMQDIICLGMNYRDHEKEAQNYSKKDFTAKESYPVYFSKRVNEAVADHGIIPSHNDLTRKLDYEAELGVIIGKDCLQVSEEEASSYIFGYTIINDVSARDLQTRHTQWYFGKSLDGFTPMGPYIVTADEIGFPPALDIECRVNGELRQKGNTKDMIYGIDRIISELSRGMELKAGTIISTGTPKGVAMGMEKPAFLKHGDVVSITIEKIGTLTNTVD